MAWSDGRANSFPGEWALLITFIGKSLKSNEDERSLMELYRRVATVLVGLLLDDRLSRHDDNEPMRHDNEKQKTKQKQVDSFQLKRKQRNHLASACFCFKNSSKYIRTYTILALLIFSIFSMFGLRQKTYRYHFRRGSRIAISFLS
uniref:Uncharacterized protein n=1 Tax=Daphnia galeata TaxID=27404 RepID=A0A8J2S9P9_9CRUS|nr:unnamed protein product [Daphnia galeata]